jgi:hypothetical protein
MKDRWRRTELEEVFGLGCPKHKHFFFSTRNSITFDEELQDIDPHLTSTTRCVCVLSVCVLFFCQKS